MPTCWPEARSSRFSSAKPTWQKATTERDSAQRQLACARTAPAARCRQHRTKSPPPAIVSLAPRPISPSFSPQVRYSPDELSRANPEIADSKINVELAEEVLRNCNVRAPFDGTVYFLPARAGAYVSVGDLLLQEADLSQLQVRAFVDEPEIGRLALGQTVKITWDALPGHTWQGTVTTLPSTVVNRGSRVVGEILCTVDNSERLLLPNVDVNTTIIASSKQDASPCRARRCTRTTATIMSISSRTATCTAATSSSASPI